jgi:hypothetical protein
MSVRSPTLVQSVAGAIARQTTDEETAYRTFDLTSELEQQIRDMEKRK